MYTFKHKLNDDRFNKVRIHSVVINFCFKDLLFRLFWLFQICDQISVWISVRAQTLQISSTDINFKLL